MTRGKGKNEEDEWIDQVQSEVQRGRVPTYIGGASPINDHDVYVQKWEVISNTILQTVQHTTASRCLASWRLFYRCGDPVAFSNEDHHKRFFHG